MTTKYVTEGKRITYSNTGSAISSGDVVRVGNRYGIAEKDIAATTGTGTVIMEGVFEVAKTTGTAYAVGDELYWDANNNKLTKTPGDDNFMGWAWEAAASGATTAKVAISPAAQSGRAANVAALSQTISGSYTQSEVQAISTKVDAILTALKNAGIMASS